MALYDLNIKNNIHANLYRHSRCPEDKLKFLWWYLEFSSSTTSWPMLSHILSNISTSSHWIDLVKVPTQRFQIMDSKFFSYFSSSATMRLAFLVLSKMPLQLLDGVPCIVAHTFMYFLNYLLITNTTISVKSNICKTKSHQF